MQEKWVFILMNEETKLENIKLNISAGGIFSKFMFGIQNIENINPNMNNFYFNNVDPRAVSHSKTNNPFDYVIQQKFDESYVDFNTIHLGNYSKFNPIENCNKINNFKNIISKIEFSDKLNKMIENCENQIKFDEHTIGIHIRLCDMNIVHASDYGIISYEDFDKCLEKEITEKTNIFVASDNNESIDKLRQKYGNIVNYVPNLMRASSETENTAHFQENHLGIEEFWLESFLEMFLLSKSSSLICRSSNVANASIIFSNSIKKIIRL